MSQPVVLPCPIVNGTCQPQAPSGSQVLLLQNAAQEPVIAVSNNLATPVTFLLPYTMSP
jgi:hypothetical protein